MDEQLLIRFLNHQCSVIDLKQIDEWIATDKANADWLFEMERIWSLKDEMRFSDKCEIEKAYKEFLSGFKKQNHHYLKRVTLTSLKYAAAILLIGLLSINLYQLNKKEITLTTNTVEVPRGQRVTLTLSDGTKVWLNSKSIFTYPVDFLADNRIVQLDGEGYFEVARNEKSPFIVHSSSLNVKVLGTKFNLKAYDEEASVTLAEGRVKVSTEDNKEEVILRPNEQAVYVKDKGRLEVLNVEAGDNIAWKGGTIVFREDPVSVVLKTLSRHYSVDFDVKRPDIKDIEITMKFTDEPLELVLEYIRLATGITYKIKKSNQETDSTVMYHVELSK